MSERADRSVISWMTDAHEQEIVEALLLAGPRKATRVVVLLANRLGPEAVSQVRDAIEQTRADPVDAIARVAMAGVGVLSSRRRRDQS